MSESRAYVFVDDAGNIADVETMASSEAQLRNACAAPGQALRWMPQTAFTSQVLGDCVDKLRQLKERPQRSSPP